MCSCASMLSFARKPVLLRMIVSTTPPTENPNAGLPQACASILAKSNDPAFDNNQKRSTH